MIARDQQPTEAVSKGGSSNRAPGSPARRFSLWRWRGQRPGLESHVRRVPLDKSEGVVKAQLCAAVP